MIQEFPWPISILVPFFLQTTSHKVPFFHPPLRHHHKREKWWSCVDQEEGDEWWGDGEEAIMGRSGCGLRQILAAKNIQPTALTHMLIHALTSVKFPLTLYLSMAWIVTFTVHLLFLALSICHIDRKIISFSHSRPYSSSPQPYP